MDNQGMFEVATRTQLRFDSPRGLLTVEQLWEVPLRSKDDFNLDVVAKTANKALKAVTEDSFVDTRRSTAQTKLEMALEVVKYIIATKSDEDVHRRARAGNKEEKARYLEILAEKQANRDSKLSEAELKKRIAALDA